VRDTKWGQTPGALIVPASGARLDEEAIRSALNAALARYKHPRVIRFAEALPRNAMGKVVLEEVRGMLEDAE
jgi:acyl-CoA synthetase (AMP-forming)/AMP-acid ligase II